MASDTDSETEQRTIRHTARGAAEYVGEGADLPLTVTDDDAGQDTRIALSEASLTPREGGRAVYEVSLTHVPGADVTVSVTSDDTDVVRVFPAALTFTSANFDTPQTVLVTAQDDDDTLNGSATISHAASGHSDFSSATASLPVTVEDDTTIAILAPAQRIWDENKATTYAVQLSAQPTDSVTVTLSTDHASIELRGPGALTFTTEDWNSQQIVWMWAYEDNDADDEVRTLTHTATGAAEFDGVTKEMRLEILDDDEIGPVFTPDTVLLGEAGSATFDVRLGTQPGSAVTLALTSGDTDALTVSPAALTFTADNWQSDQAVTAAGVDDADGDDEAVTVTLAGSGGDADDGYAGKSWDYAATVADDEAARVVVPASLVLDSNKSGFYNAWLSQRPAADVTVAVTLDDDAPATLTDTELTFTASNWDSPQRVRLSAANLAYLEEEEGREIAFKTGTITHRASGARAFDGKTAETALRRGGGPGRPDRHRHRGAGRAGGRNRRVRRFAAAGAPGAGNSGRDEPGHRGGHCGQGQPDLQHVELGHGADGHGDRNP